MRTLHIGVAMAGLGMASLGLFAKGWQDELPAPPPKVVTVKVVVSSAGGGTLSYQWRATDGTIRNVNAATTTWTLPDGPGIHFAYVLVSNGKGGFTERRVLVNSDTFGNPLTTPPPTTLTPPPAPAAGNNTYRGVIQWGSIKAINHGVRMASVPEFVEDTGTGKHYPPSGTVSTNGKGDFLVSGVPNLTLFSTQCAVDGVTFADCSSNGPTTLNIPTTVTDYVYGTPSLTFPAVISGSLVLQDGSPCGTQNEFFNVHVTATATLLNSFDIQLAGPVPVNDLGDYSLPYNASATFVALQCAGAANLKVTVSGLNPTGVTDLGQVKLPGISAPKISSMTATLGSTVVGTLAAPISAQPSDIAPASDAFLAEKGLDTRVEACQYYKAIGAVTSCSAAGDLMGAISYNDWQRMVKIGKFATGTQYSATYVNKEDLNLTRVHQSVSYGANNTAAVVCNHVGPKTDSQMNVDIAINNTVAGLDLVACVAMDYMVHTGVNGGKPFTRFYIFGPSGQLLPSINLDTRREKFVPGTCVVCHGGDKYAGHFPANGVAANVGGHFLPYDTGNFEFSSKVGLRELDQEEAIYNLNQNVLKAGATASETSLINGWYASGHRLIKNYLPSSWAAQSATAKSFYQNVLARSCRTCHAAMVEGYNFDHYTNITPGGSFYRGEDATFDVGTTVCGGREVVRSHSMPNSLVTFNRFWNSAGSSVDQPSITSQFFGTNVSPTGTCTKGLEP